MKDNLKLLTFLIILSQSAFCLLGQNYNIDYYGIVSKDIDSNMAKMTGDLYYTQLSEINTFSITDKRENVVMETKPDSQTFSNTNLSFYIQIEKDDNEKWKTSYHIFNKRKDSEDIKIKQYDSFYKILMEPKSALQEELKNLIENGSENLELNEKTNSSPSIKNQNISSTEILSGTWSGEENINKIVILRGGRGFIIFNNGASMNVSISISNKEVTQIQVLQNGKSNASFYPELPRNTALNAALSAEPIKWILTVKDNNTLSGVKTTLIPDGDSFTKGDIAVEWKKVN